MTGKAELIESMKKHHYIRTLPVEEAFQKVPREYFVLDEYKEGAYSDTPLPIPAGQTISAPSMIAIMLEVAELKKGQKVLEIGAGSGYNAALVGEIVGEENIVAIERIPELMEFATKNLDKAGYRIKVVGGDGTLGYKEAAPYDRIIVTAAAPKISQYWVEQLKTGGKVIAPIGSKSSHQELVVATKSPEGLVETKRHGGCVFVPLIGEEGWPG
ncbi:MAG: protein-L-isoaspartate(D-aspartate) O-methyltransferase [Candidatus Altiarchaeota archaeon]|nr:protein-L-isoaspartate(D-aspartate) O-methyltransferase [Candidatus Altiarchaeota archaeon]